MMLINVINKANTSIIHKTNAFERYIYIPAFSHKFFLETFLYLSQNIVICKKRIKNKFDETYTKINNFNFYFLYYIYILHYFINIVPKNRLASHYRLCRITRTSV